jgi:uncharacterized protein (TIGR02996 family)
MPDLRATFLKSICEAPQDDAPRSIYADWLEEHGDLERAEFSPEQIEIASAIRDALDRIA